MSAPPCLCCYSAPCSSWQAVSCKIFSEILFSLFLAKRTLLNSNHSLKYSLPITPVSVARLLPWAPHSVTSSPRRLHKWRSTWLARLAAAVSGLWAVLALHSSYQVDISTISTHIYNIYNIYAAAGGPDAGHLARGGAADPVLARRPHRGDGGHGRHPAALSPLPAPHRRHPLLRRGAGIQ